MSVENECFLYLHNEAVLFSPYKRGLVRREADEILSRRIPYGLKTTEVANWVTAEDLYGQQLGLQ